MRTAGAILCCLMLAGCGKDQVLVRPDPPAVTGCLDVPSAHVPDEPARPEAGAPITDAYVVALLGWANALLGVIAQDRVTWAGERDCVQRLRAAGQLL